MKLDRFIYRNLFHVFFGSLFLLMIRFLEHKLLLISLSIMLILGAFIALMLDSGIKVPIFWHLAVYLAKESERKHLLGFDAFLSVFAILLSCVAFPKQIALLSVAMFTFGDAISAIVGKIWGRYRLYQTKTLEGAVAEFVLCLFLGMLMLAPWKALLVAFSFTFIEVIVPEHDNFALILGTAIVIRTLI